MKTMVSWLRLGCILLIYTNKNQIRLNGRPRMMPIMIGPIMPIIGQVAYNDDVISKWRSPLQKLFCISCVRYKLENICAKYHNIPIYISWVINVFIGAGLLAPPSPKGWQKSPVQVGLINLSSFHFSIY